MNIIERIMISKEISEQPPVLLDIGASEGIHPPWKPIAKYCVCIAFDPDAREFSDAKLRRHFKDLHSFDCVVSPDPKKQVEFFLTRSPYCSSLLEPDIPKLNEWAFAPLFSVERKVKVKAKTLTQVLREVGIHYVDWFKVDSQGMDLQLFNSLTEKLCRKVLVAEFEPGIIDAYKNEDKLYDVLKSMKSFGFWLSDIEIKGSQRITAPILELLFPHPAVRKLAMFSHKTSPGWAELLYINSFQDVTMFSKRDVLLGWVFATIQEQHGFAYQLSGAGKKIWGGDIFDELFFHSERMMKRQIISWRLLPYIKRKFSQVYDKTFG